MYLKALEVSNFKSFKGEATIPLDRGFTAITGPNGSGKSNCGDAIQFVLGPRSNRVIRAQNSKDLIFNGGKNSKPARDCSVTLVFANPIMSSGRRRLPVDKEEVRMTRSIRLTKSNNVVTSYLLDGDESSQRSFHRILGAANARPDGYNIVLQGDVTSLAKMTSKERRKVLDGVAGVTSYDDEIRKAGKQKEKVEGYIERIGLLEEEQKARLKDLKKEKDLAIKVKDLVDEASTARTIAYQARFASQQAEISFQVEEKARYLREANELDAENRESAKVFMTLEDRIAEMQKEISALMGGENDGLLKAIQSLQVRVDLHKDKIGEAEVKDEEDVLELQQLEEQLTDAKQALVEFNSSLSSAQADVEAAQLALREAEAEEAAVNLAMESTGESNAVLARAVAKASEALEKARELVANAQSEVDKTAATADAISTQLAQAQDEAEEARLALGELELRGEELGGDDPDKDKKDLSKKLMAAQSSEAKLAEESRVIEAKLRDTERKLISTRSEMENRVGGKGLAGGAAAVIGARDRGELRGVIGTIAELCAPKDSTHEDALAAAIGGGMTSIVVEDDEVAAKAIRWLAEKKMGRATFLPLNKLANTRAAGKAVMVARKPGVIGFAYELLDYDPRIDIAVRFALRNTLVVDSMATARANMGGVRLVTLRGDITETGGAMIGGSKRKMNVSFGGRIQGASEVEKLSAEVDRLTMMSETVNGALSQARKDQAAIRAQINALSDSDRSSQIAEWRAELKQAKSGHNKALGAVAELERKLAGLESQAAQALHNLDRSQNNHAAAEQELEDARHALEESSPAHLKDRLHEAQLKRTTAAGLMASAQTALSSGSGQSNLLQGRVDDLGSRIEVLVALRVKRSEDIDSWQSIVATDSIDLKEKEAERSQILEDNKGLEDEHNRLLEERAELRSSMTQKSNEAINNRRMAEEITRAIGIKQEGLQELVVEMQEANIEPAEAGVSLPSVGEAERKVRNLERRLESYGPVNMLAIEQYEACEARLESMKDDFKTLQERRKHLIDVTEQLESQRKERLLKVLVSVNENFKVAYKALSDGGRGELFLENPDEPFKGGLELWAQPRGKSSKVTRHQLSGGEQSMAALALIFAIQDYDPSPFYYFDEVDQNLDAYNAERIAEMCRQRSKRAQFIMVTLRKVSLRLADHHIGITHGGDGCSRRIVDFDREQAIALGEAADLEAQEAAKKNQARLDELAQVEAEMPEVPDPLPTPQSLGGLTSYLEDESEDVEEAVVEEASTMSSLMERADELTEDIEERLEVTKAVLEADEAEVSEATAELDELEEA